MSAVCYERLVSNSMQPQVQPPFSSRQRRDGQPRRDPPPPYPGNPRHLYTPRYRQSYSGSEASTDISLSSTENLSTSTRQEPQGEETSNLGRGPPGDPSPSLLAQLGLSLPTDNGLEVKTTNSSTFYVTGNMQPAYTAAIGHNQYPVCQPEMNGVTTTLVDMSQPTQSVCTPPGQAHLSQACTTTSVLYNQPSATSDNPAIYNNSPIVNHHHNNTNNNNNVYSTSPLLTHYDPPPQYRTNQNFVNMRYTSSPTPTCDKQQANIYQYQQNQLAPPAQYGHAIHDSQTYNRSTSISPKSQKTISGCVSSARPGSSQSSASESRPAGQLPNHLQSESRPAPQLHNHLQSESRPAPQLPNHLQSESRPAPQLPNHLQNESRPAAQPPHSNHPQNVSRPAPPLPNHLPSESRPAPPLPNHLQSESRPASQLPNHLQSESRPTPPIPHPNYLQLDSIPRPPPRYVNQQPSCASTSSPTCARTTEFISSPPKPKPQLPARPKSAEPRYSLEGRRFAVAPPIPEPGEIGRCFAVAPPIPDPGDIPPPPEYRNPPSNNHVPPNNFPEDIQDLNLQKSSDLLSQLTRSQPDLTHVSDVPAVYRERPSSASLKTGEIRQQQKCLQQQQQQQLLSQWSNSMNTNPNQSLQKKELDHAAVATRATQMVERLSEENRSLRKELEGYYKKICKMQKIEQEIQKVKDAHESLDRQSKKREHLERAMRYKLEMELKKVTETSMELKEQLDKALTDLFKKGAYNVADAELKQELPRKDSIISKLISQNKELIVSKEKLQADFSAQKTTIQEQRGTIEVLDNALRKTHAIVTKYEEELKQKRHQDDKVQMLQHAMTQLHVNNEKRELIEHKLRSKLEEDLRNLKSQQNGLCKTPDTDEGISSDMESPTSVQSLIRQMQDKEQRVAELEAEIIKLEQRFLEESSLRQLAIDAASMPKEARIAALEENSVESDKIIAEARTERLQHLEEVYQANRHAAELQSKLKMMQAQLAEKDAMIKVLQRHSSLSRAGSVSSLFGSPIHSPRPSILSTTSRTSSTNSQGPSSANTSMSLPLSSQSASAASSRQNSQISQPASGTSSRQNSQIDTPLQLGPSMRQKSQEEVAVCTSSSQSFSRKHCHSKSSSTASAGQASTCSDGAVMEASRASLDMNVTPPLPTDKLSKLALQSTLLGKDGSEKLKKCLWQV